MRASLNLAPLCGAVLVRCCELVQPGEVIPMKKRGRIGKVGDGMTRDRCLPIRSVA